MTAVMEIMKRGFKAARLLQVPLSYKMISRWMPLRPWSSYPLKTRSKSRRWLIAASPSLLLLKIKETMMATEPSDMSEIVCTRSACIDEHFETLLDKT